jgi:hypothetical protein
MFSKVKAFLATPAGKAVEHAVYVFVAAFTVDAYGNRDHLLAAHGLDGLKSAGYAAAAAAAYAGFVKVRPLLAQAAAAILNPKGKS